MVKLTFDDFAGGALKTKSAAQELGITRVTLIRWRAAGKGPPCVRIGNAWHYPKRHIDAFKAATIAAKQKRPTFDELVRRALDDQAHEVRL